MDWNRIGTNIMHFSPAAIALSTTFALVSSAGFAQAAHEPAPQSVQLVADGTAAEQAGELDRAFGLYVSALAFDPLNVTAYVAMGDVAYAQQLYGSAIRYYTRALDLDPNNAAALGGQGGAYVAKGAMQRAEGNLQKLKLVCASKCEALTRLKKRIAAGPPERVVTAEELQSKPTVEAIEPAAANVDDGSDVLVNDAP